MTLKVDGIGTNPIYLNNGYPVTNSFRGDYAQTNSISLDTSQLNTTNIAPLEKDTLNISASDKIKSTSKEQSTSNIVKWGLGALITIGGAIATHKLVIEPRIVQKNMQDIFLCNYTKSEAMALKKKYKDIYKIKDTNKFLDKMFEELKNDFKLNDIPIKLEKDYKSGEKIGEITAGSVYSMQYAAGFNVIKIDKNLEQKLGRGKLIEQLTHEMRHARQDVARYQVGTNEELYKMFELRLTDTFKNDRTYNMNDLPQDIKDTYDSFILFFKNAKVPKITNSDKNYEWSRKQLESFSICANNSKEAYLSEFYETDAKRIGNAMRNMIC